MTTPILDVPQPNPEQSTEFQELMELATKLHNRLLQLPPDEQQKIMEVFEPVPGPKQATTETIEKDGLLAGETPATSGDSELEAPDISPSPEFQPTIVVAETHAGGGNPPTASEDNVNPPVDTGAPSVEDVPGTGVVSLPSIDSPVIEAEKPKQNPIEMLVEAFTGAKGELVGITNIGEYIDRMIESIKYAPTRVYNTVQLQKEAGNKLSEGPKGSLDDIQNAILALHTAEKIGDSLDAYNALPKNWSLPDRPWNVNINSDENIDLYFLAHINSETIMDGKYIKFDQGDYGRIIEMLARKLGILSKKETITDLQKTVSSEVYDKTRGQYDSTLHTLRGKTQIDGIYFSVDFGSNYISLFIDKDHLVQILEEIQGKPKDVS